MPTSIGHCCGERRLPVGRFHQRHQPADEERDHRVDQRHREAGGEHGRVPALGLPHEVPVEGDQPLRRLPLAGTGRPADSVEEFQDFLSCPAALVVTIRPRLSLTLEDTRSHPPAAAEFVAGCDRLPSIGPQFWRPLNGGAMNGVTQVEIDQRVFDLYDEYCHGRIDRREFLQARGRAGRGGARDGAGAAAALRAGADDLLHRLRASRRST